MNRLLYNIQLCHEGYFQALLPSPVSRDQIPNKSQIQILSWIEPKIKDRKIPVPGLVVGSSPNRESLYDRLQLNQGSIKYREGAIIYSILEKQL